MDAAFDIAALLDAVARWAAADPRIAAVLLVGSHARGAARADSDVDLVVLCDEPDAFVSDRSWVTTFGVARAQRVEEWGRVRSVRVRYAGGPEVEFGFASPTWAALPLDAGSERVLRDGYRVVFDRTGVATALAPLRSRLTE